MTTTTGTFTVKVHSAGVKVGNTAWIEIAGTRVAMPPIPRGQYDRGLYVATVGDEGQILETRIFDTHERVDVTRHDLDAETFATFIEFLPVGRLVVVAVKDEATKNLTARAERACMAIGSGLIHNLAERGSWAIIGRKGAGPGTAIEALSNTDAVDLSQDIPFVESGRTGVCVTATSTMVGGRHGVLPATVYAQGRKAGSDFWNKSGLAVAVIDEHTGARISWQMYELDTRLADRGSGNADRFAADIAGLPEGRIVAIATQGSQLVSELTAKACDACTKLGSRYAAGFKASANASHDMVFDQGSWAMIGVKGGPAGAPEGSAAEAGSTTGPAFCCFHSMPRADDAKEVPIAVTSAGSHAGMFISTAALEDKFATGLNVAILDETDGSLLHAETYGTHDTTAAADEFAALIEDLPIGALVLVAVKQDAAACLTDRAKRACATLGSLGVWNLRPGSAWALIGRKGAAPGCALEMWGTSEWPGTLTTGVGVRLQYVPDKRLLEEIRVRSAGLTFGNRAVVRVLGASNAAGHASESRRGLNAVCVDALSGGVRAMETFDTNSHDKEGEADKFVGWVSALDRQSMIAIGVRDDARDRLNERATQACAALGSERIGNLAYRGSWAFIGRKGCGPGQAAEAVCNAGPASCRYWLIRAPALWGIDVAAQSAGVSVGNSARIAVGGEEVKPPGGYGRGLNVVAVDETWGMPCAAKRYDTWERETDADAFAAFIEDLPPGSIVVIAVQDNAARNLTERAKRACEMIGSGLIRNLGDGGSWCAIGIKGAAPGSAMESLEAQGATAVATWIPVLPKPALTPSRKREAVTIAIFMGGLFLLSVATLARIYLFTPDHRPSSSTRSKGDSGPSDPPTPSNPPPPSTRPKLEGRRYNEVTYLTAHNAMASRGEGWGWPDVQQNLSIPQLLEYGVRALMLDVHPHYPKEFSDSGIRILDDLRLCHGSCSSWFHPWLVYRRFVDALRDIVAFLEANTTEIVTVFLETPASSGWQPDPEVNQMFWQHITESGADRHLFWPDPQTEPLSACVGIPPAGAKIWNVDQAPTNTKAGEFKWPLIEEMVKDKKRL
jgi:hypothetical protein